MVDEYLTKQHYRIYPLFEAVFVGVGTFIAILITTYFIYFHSVSAQTEEIKEGLLRTAKVVSSFIDTDIHKTFISSKQQESDAYYNAIRPLEIALKTDPSIAYLYTTIMKNGKVYFILDATAPGDADQDGIEDKAFIMDEYTEASADVIRALSEQKVIISDKPYTDRWGKFLSGYIPLFDSDNQFIGTLCIDIQAAAFFARLEPIERATKRTMVMGFFISFLVGSLVWFTRNFGLKVNQRRNYILDKLLNKKDS